MHKFPDVDLKDLPYAKFILEQVKKRAAVEKDFWVCELLDQINAPKLQEEARVMVKRVGKALEPYSLVTNWVHESAGKMVPYEEKDAYRRAWIDHMLRELEK